MATKKRALLMGINKYQNVSGLNGCLNDVDDYNDLLQKQFGFATSDIIVLKDQEVVKQKIRAAWTKSLKGLSAGDLFVVQFAGHGSQVPDKGDDPEDVETDGADEIFCLYDMDPDFKDENTYLLDDEWYKWCKEIPVGVNATFVFDSCHSGTGLRMLMKPRSGVRQLPLEKRPIIDYQATQRRLRQRKGTRALSPLTHEEVLSGQDTKATVLSRFIEPPAWVLTRIRQGTKRGFRALVAKEDLSKNQILFAGARSDQTAADAYIGNSHRGAFSYYFCDAIRKADGRISLGDAVAAVKQSLIHDGFDQVPQLEPEGVEGLLFSAEEADGSGAKKFPQDDSATLPAKSIPHCPHPSSSSADSLKEIAGLLSKLADRPDLVETLQRFLDGPSRDLPTTGERELVYVHGICKHPPGYSDGWWNALKPHLTKGLAAQLETHRREVLWSQIVSRELPMSRDVSAARALQFADRQVKLAASLKASLTERLFFANQASRQPQPADRSPLAASGERALLGIPGLDCVDDFVKYLTLNGIRRRVQKAFLDVVVPLLDSGCEIDVVSHSWGTVVAYEALRTLDVRSNIRGRVRNMFTVGAALSIGVVQRELETSDGLKPRHVDNWINLDAHGDIVGGPLAGFFQGVDTEYLDLAAVGCKPNLVGLVSPACAHSSYFDANNDAVNDGVFAKYMN